MFALDQAEAAALDLTDEAPRRPEVFPADARDDEIEAVAAENRALRSAIRRLLAIIDRAPNERRLSEIEGRMIRAEETIEDLVAIVVRRQTGRSQQITWED